LSLDSPARQRIESGCAQCVACGEIEAGVMPRTSNRVPDDDPLGQRAAIVCALGSNGEKPFSAPNEQDILLADATREDLSVGDGLRGDSACQINRRSLVAAHIVTTSISVLAISLA